jgi:hypothetical protein
MTVGRSGEPREKYVVASLRICKASAYERFDAVAAAYLQCVAQFTGNHPLILHQLILPEVVLAFRSEQFDCLPVGDDEAQHIVS